MKRYTLLLAILALATFLHAQSVELAPTVIASAGDYYEGTSISLSWTLGEVAVATLPGNGITLTQGFQQGDLGGTGFKLKEIEWSIHAYPNPADNIVNVQFSVPEASDYIIEVQDVTGKLISQKKYDNIQSGDEIQVNVSSYKYGVYFFKVFNTDRSQLRVLSIRKL